ncbi:MAG: hypothetical protein M3337_08525, partial [Actinomycetota bacterium]|nr:hypothetical protein [Actinomycetota bacterium]
IAYANDTLDPADRAWVTAALDESSVLRRELEGIVVMRRAAEADDAPSTVPASVWERLDGDREVEDVRDAPVVRPLPPPPLPPPDLVDFGRGRRGKVILVAAAAAVAGVATGALVSTQLSDDTPDAQTTNPPSPTGQSPVSTADGSSPLDTQAQQALRSASSSMVGARTATFDVEGKGTVAFDGSVLGQPDTRLEVGIDLSGESAVVFDDDGADYQFFVEFEGVSGPVLARPQRTTSEVILVDGVEYESDNGEPFTESSPSDPEDAGLFAELVVRPDVLGRLPEMADGEIADLGLTELGGATVRHLRFDLEAGTLAAPTGTNVAEVWIADDGSVRRLRLSSSGPAEIEGVPDATLDLRVDIVLDELGQPLEIIAPS